MGNRLEKNIAEIRKKMNVNKYFLKQKQKVSKPGKGLEQIILTTEKYNS